MTSALPIYSIIPALQTQLNQRHEAILEAAPGAGKTTAVPLAFLEADWLGKRKIVMLEPRRLAAKSAAKRLADQLGEPLGQRVGYQIRQEGRQSAHTQILVVTEGILTRMLQDDPSLDDVALIIFDEFHERNLHSDLAFALSLQARELFREEDPLKLLVMSATLDSERLTELLHCEPIICEGRQFPIEMRYANLALKQQDVPLQIAKQIQQALREEDGSLLVFLPGQREIRKVQSLLETQLPNATELLSLYGDMSMAEQEHVIAPAPKGQRKVVLATSIAQTSLTIDGIRVVIDSGLSREARFDAKTATTRLHTRRASQAETVQRAGRAGRLQAGVCYRWWSEEQQHRLSAHNAPQIELEDLSHLVMDVARWGVQEREELDWISLPPLAHWQQATGLLTQLGLLEAASKLALTADGEALASMPLPPRLARLLLEASRHGDTHSALEAAALLYEGIAKQSQDSNLHNALTYAAKGKTWQSSIHALKRHLPSHLSDQSYSLAACLASAFPDRIAMRQRQQGEETLFKLSNGRQALLANHDANANSEFLIALELGGHAQREADWLYLTCAISLVELEQALASQIEIVERCEWDKANGGLVGAEETWLGKLKLTQTRLSHLPDSAVTMATCSYIRQQGLQVLNWDDDSLALRARIQFAHKHLDQTIPDASDACLLEHLEDWLGPFLTGVKRIQQLDKLSLLDPLLALLDWPQQQTLHSLPTRIPVASGSSVKVDYQAEPPVIRVKLQEMFGETQSPVIAGQTVKIELLSPAQRPLAVTMDLAFFWKEAYPDVRKEMRGRYPKHPWPEDPLSAEATAKTNRALRNTKT
ncbi:ATP-dependent RNA helicase HrpB [Marinomonas aquimarina]|uniref:ATP-dependent RNA helicase HrpB n=1 Tax=Marinomonas aquimarina TaxID=295068 RepID=A0A1A8TPU2_9GAMM|nr:ATP-dependent helicase HrpB [Marinomonas aquimarina]SBS36283.1 ATP-dependent RNA helicase HrpB [Marinomonas aquimarina]